MTGSASRLSASSHMRRKRVEVGHLCFLLCGTRAREAGGFLERRDEPH